VTSELAAYGVETEAYSFILAPHSQRGSYHDAVQHRMHLFIWREQTSL